MNREIKFRIWSFTQRAWLRDGYSEFLALDLDGGAIRVQTDSCENPSKEVGENIIVEQFTGLKDKNGKEIYEGDVVLFHYFHGDLGENLGYVESEHELTGIVNHGKYGYSIEAIKGEHWKGYTGYDDGEGNSNFLELLMMNESSLHEESFEVIGNIHENPELLS